MGRDYSRRSLIGPFRLYSVQWYCALDGHRNLGLAVPIKGRKGWQNLKEGKSRIRLAGERKIKAFMVPHQMYRTINLNNCP